MNLQRLTKKIGLLALSATLFLASCSNNDESLTEETSATTEDVVALARQEVLSEDVSAEVSNIVDSDELDFGIAARPGKHGKKKGKSCVADCATRTVEETTNGRIVTLDFGTEGCQGKRGKTFAGKIIVTYVENESGYTKTVTFSDFTVDGNKVEGTKKIEKVNANANGNPQSTKEMNITITLTTGEVLTRKGNKVREKIEGASTTDRSDDVTLTTGSWDSVGKDGKTKNVTVKTALRREYSCRYIVSGVVEFITDGQTYSLNFGDGTCDDKATLTKPDGTTEEITLRKK